MLPAYILTTAPALEPVTLAELRAFLRVDSDDEISLLSALNGVAREYVEQQTGRALLTQQWKLICDEWPGLCESNNRRVCFGNCFLQIDRTPLASVETVKYYPAAGGAQATLSASVYRTIIRGAEQPGFIELVDGQSWPDLAARSDAVEVNFTAGATKASLVPKTIKQAIMLIVAHFYELRQPVNVGNIVNEVPRHLQALLEMNRVGGWIA